MVCASSRLSHTVEVAHAMVHTTEQGTQATKAWPVREVKGMFPEVDTGAGTCHDEGRTEVIKDVPSGSGHPAA